jgi:hypothetical protein
MRAELVVSRVLLVFLLGLASTSAWSHNNVQTIVANTEVKNHKSLTSDAGPWPVNTGIQVANNGAHPSADLSLSIHMDRVPVNSVTIGKMKMN